MLLAAGLLAATAVGCKNAGIDPEHGASSGTGAANATGSPEEVEDKMIVSEWDKRTAAEITQVGAVTAVTPDLSVYDCREFGIEPGAKTDASEAIGTAAETVCQRGGGILYFPAGVYRIDAEIDIKGDGTWLCLCGDTDGSSVFQLRGKSESAACVRLSKNNTHLSFISFVDQSKEAVSVSVEADGCSLYGCDFKKQRPGATGTCIEVSGAFDTVRQCTFWAENLDAYFVEFTKFPGREAYGNVLCDVHFGGSFRKTMLISSRDSDGTPENITVFRNLFLLPSDPMIEVRTVNGLAIVNNMLDAATRAVGICSEGRGVYNVEIRDNYIGTSTGGVCCEKSDVPAGNISIHDNYIWSPDGIIVSGSNYTGISVQHDYFVLGAGNALFMSLARQATVGGNLVANIGGVSPELDILERDAASKISTEGFGSASVPDSTTEVAEIAIPAVNEKTAQFSGAPEITGNTTVGICEDYFNVKDFGAIGDGITDDTAAVKECIKRAKAKSGTAYFPEGTYLVSETVSVSKDDSKILRVKGAGAGKTVIKGAASLDGAIFEIKMKYNFYIYDLCMEHPGQGSCIDALFVKAFDCEFSGGANNTAPVLWFHGSNCWAVRCDFVSANPESYCLCYTRWKGEISINNYIVDSTFAGAGKGVLVGDGSTVGDGRCEGLKIIGNTFHNTGATQTEIYEILHVNIAYNEYSGAENAIFLSNRGYGPDGIYIDHNKISAANAGIISGTVSDGGDYISMVVIHDNNFEGCKTEIEEKMEFNKEMINQ